MRKRIDVRALHGVAMRAVLSEWVLFGSVRFVFAVMVVHHAEEMCFRGSGHGHHDLF